MLLAFRSEVGCSFNPELLPVQTNSSTSHLQEKWDVRTESWVMSIHVASRPEWWHLILAPPLPLCWPCHLQLLRSSSHPCNYWQLFSFFVPLWHPGLLLEAHRGRTSALSSGHRPSTVLHLPAPSDNPHPYRRDANFSCVVPSFPPLQWWFFQPESSEWIHSGRQSGRKFKPVCSDTSHIFCRNDLSDSWGE